MQRRLWTLLLLAVTACWGASFAFIHEAVVHVDPYAFVAIRFTLATAIVLALGGRRMLSSITRSTMWDGAWLGLLLASGYMLQTASLVRTSASNAAFLTGISVVLVPVLLSLGGWRLPKLGWLAIALATAGLAILTLDLHSFTMNVGDALAVGCAIAYAGQIVLTSRFSDRHDLWALTFVELAVTAVASGTVWLLAGARTAALSMPSVWGAILFAAVLCTVVAYLVMNAAQRIVSAWEAGLVFTTEPLFATGVAIALGMETWHQRTLFGGGIILIAMVAAEYVQHTADDEAIKTPVDGESAGGTESAYPHAPEEPAQTPAK